MKLLLCFAISIIDLIWKIWGFQKTIIDFSIYFHIILTYFGQFSWFWYCFCNIDHWFSNKNISDLNMFHWFSIYFHRFPITIQTYFHEFAALGKLHFGCDRIHLIYIYIYICIYTYICTYKYTNDLWKNLRGLTRGYPHW